MEFVGIERSSNLDPRASEEDDALSAFHQGCYAAPIDLQFNSRLVNLGAEVGFLERNHMLLL